jgi:hypothetical protein
MQSAIVLAMQHQDHAKIAPEHQQYRTGKSVYDEDMCLLHSKEPG